MKIAIISINRVSLESALKLSKVMRDFEITLLSKEGCGEEKEIKKGSIKEFKKLDDAISDVWREFEAIIFIVAVGAVVRKIAPFLENKARDPAILVVNLSLNRVIPLLSGHLGGANSLSQTVAKRLNAINFITTASEQTKTLSFDLLAKSRGWRIENLKALARVSNRLIDKKPVKVATFASIFETIEPKEGVSLVSESSIDENSVVILPFGRFKTLTLRPKISIGVGCCKGVKLEKVKEAFLLFQKEFGFLESDIKGFYSFVAKRGEKGLLEFVDSMGKEIKFFERDAINSLKNSFTQSASQKFFSLKGVAEPSAILGSNYKELVIQKRAYFGQITFAGAV